MTVKTATGIGPATSSGKPPPKQVLREAIANLNVLPTLPEVARRAMAAVNEVDQSMGRLGQIVEQDQAMATALLRLANSTLYRAGQAVESLSHALVRLGLRESKNLILAVALKSLFGKGTRISGHFFENLWRHASLTATLSRRLNQLLGLGFQGEEFSGGLAHDIGRVLFAIVLQEQFAAVDPLDFQEAEDILARERQIVETDHCQFGVLYAIYNQLPLSLVAVIQSHHNPAEAQSHQELVWLVHTADHMANYLQRERTALGYPLEKTAGWAHLTQSLSRSQSRDMAERARKLMAETEKEGRQGSTF